jgi:pyruvate/2-oxoglutarate dehydrogenase complex dihydrolipoamide acyltransferase (E2) component
MLACERWTLTQSSGWSAALAWLALALLLGLLSGFAAMSASRVAETVAAAELCDDDADADAEPAWDGEPVGDVDAEPVPDGEPVADADADDGDAEPGVGLGFGLELDGGGDTVLLDVLPDAGAVGEAEADVDEPEGDGDGDVVGLEVDGCGVGVLTVGSTSHVVSVLALAVLLVLAVLFVLAVVRALAAVLALDEAVVALTVPARAAPGQPASTPRVRNPPASRLSTAARTCARRMNIALSTLLIEATVCSLWDSEATG